MSEFGYVELIEAASHPDYSPTLAFAGIVEEPQVAIHKAHDN